MKEEDRLKELEDEYKSKIEYYKESKKRISKGLEGTEGKDREAVEYRISCCQNLIDDYRLKLNPTKKKEMYK